MMDERSEPLPPGARVVQWYRFSQGRRLLRALWVGVPLLVLGDVAVGLAISLDGLSLGAQIWTLLLGIGLTAAGPGYVIYRLRDMWGEDHYLALRTDGVHYQGPVARWFVDWDDVEDIDQNASGQPRLWLRDGTETILVGEFSGVSEATLLAKLKTTRRKALFGLYR